MNGPKESVASAETPAPSPDPAVTGIERGIEQTRTELGETLVAIERKLAMPALREKAMAELRVVDEKLKGTLVEHFEEAKAALKAELAEAKSNMKHEVQDALVQAKQAVRASTIGKVETMARRANETTVEVRDSVLQTIWRNPLPAALAGVGLAWLYMNRQSGPGAAPELEYPGGWRPPAGSAGAAGQRTHRPGQDPIGSASRTVSRVAHGVQDKVSEIANAAGEMAGQASHAAGQLAHEATETAGSLVQHASESAGRLVHDAGEMTTRVAEQARHQVRRVDDSLREAMSSNPLAVGAAVLAAGALLGLALPRTRREDALMGDARDHLVDRARDAAHVAVGQAEHLAHGLGEIRLAADPGAPRT